VLAVTSISTLGIAPEGGENIYLGCHPPRHKTVAGEPTGVTLSDAIVDAADGTPGHLGTKV